MDQVMNLTYECNNSAVYDVEDVNTSFAKGSIKVMYTGINRNKSCINKDVVERALPSLKNVPIVCHWDEEVGEIGGHDIEIKNNGNGSFAIRHLTEPCGVVPESATFQFVNDKDDNGVEHEYLVVDGVLLWKRQDVFNHIVNDLDGKVKHSMEIKVRNGESKDGIYNVSDFEFTALCLLESVEPCFQGSELELYSINNFKQKMEEMMSELRDCFSKVESSSEENDKEISTEGGNTALDEKMKLVEKYGINIEELDYSIEDMTVEELEEKFAAMTEKEESQPEETFAEEAADESGEQHEEAQEESFELNTNVEQELRKAIASYEVMKPWGYERAYWFINFDIDLKVVYFEEMDTCNIYGAPYEMNGDEVVIRIDEKVRKKRAYVDYVEGEEPEAEELNMFDNAANAYTDISEKYSSEVEKTEKLTAEVEELRKFKECVEAERYAAAKNELFAKFQDLDSVEEFENLKNSCDGMAIEDIEKECFVIRGKNVAIAKFSLEKEKTPKFIVEKNISEDKPKKKPYGKLFEIYNKE